MEDPGDASVTRQLATATNVHHIEGAVHGFTPGHDDPERAQHRFADLRQQCLRFLEKVKGRFGANSRESVTIHDKLGEFTAAKISKREAYFTIWDELGNHEDLRQDLQAIQYHEDARWGLQDFYELPLSAPQMSPTFLQPQHQPQLPLPSLSGFLSGSPYTPPIQPLQPSQLSNNAELLYGQYMTPLSVDRNAPSYSGQPIYETVNGGYNRNSAYSPQQYEQRGNTSGSSLFGGYIQTISQKPQGAHLDMPSPQANQFAHPMPGYAHQIPPTTSRIQTQDYSPYLGYSPTSVSNSPVRGVGGYTPSQRSFSLKENCGKAQYSNGAFHHHTIPSHSRRRPISPEAVNHSSSPQLASPNENRLGAAPSLPGTSHAAVLSLPAYEILTVGDHIRNGNHAPTEMSEEKHSEGRCIDEDASIALPRPFLPTKISPPSKVGGTSGKGLRTQQGQFVHGLCGKSFNTRHAVKKHHWGSRMDDRETTTGCWAKHKKPDVSWDDHSSCGIGDNTPKARVKKRVPSQTSEVKFQAPVTPSIIPKRVNRSSGHPTHDDFRHMVAESPNSTSTIPRYYFQPDIAPHHAPFSSHGTQRSFDTLLTVVNAASNIDAPKPQGRIDSVVSRLDARAASIDFQVRDTQTWLDPSNGQGSNALDDTTGSLLPPPTIGLGIMRDKQEEPYPMVAKTYNSGMGNEGPVSVANFAKHKVLADNTVEASREESVLDTTETCSSKTRKRNRISNISKKELKGLGFDFPPSPGKKRRKDAVSQTPTTR